MLPGKLFKSTVKETDMSISCSLAVFLVVYALGCWADGTQTRDRPFMYADSVPALAPGEVRRNEAMRFPLTLETEVRQRYVLTNMQRDVYYIAHLSYLGSPSIMYNLHLTRLPRATVGELQQKNQAGPGQRHLSDVNRMYVKARKDVLLFDFLGGEGEVDNGDHDPANDDSFVPVLEVRGYRNGFPHEPEKWKDFRYNIRLDVVGRADGLTMAIMWNVITVIVMGVFVIGFVAPWVISTAAGDTTNQRSRRDFLIFFW